LILNLNVFTVTMYTGIRIYYKRGQNLMGFIALSFLYEFTLSTCKELLDNC